MAMQAARAIAWSAEVPPMLLIVLLVVAVLLVAYLLYALVNPEAFQ